MTENDMEERQGKQWSELPGELLSIVGSNLVGVDFFIFRELVCKSWQSIPTPLSRPPLPPPSSSPLSQTPCLICFDNKIFHPICNDYYVTRLPPEYCGNISFSKENWFLSTNPYDIFLVNLSTKATMQLPSYPRVEGEIDPVHFSSMYFSPLDFTVFGLSSLRNKKYMAISLWKPGGEWISRRLKRLHRFTVSSCNPIMLKGLYYILGSEGNLISFNPVTNTYKWAATTRTLCKKLRDWKCQSYLVEDNGQLLSVHLSYNGEYVVVYRLNPDKKDWEAVKCLEKKTLYVSSTSSFCEAATQPGMGNKIFLPRHNRRKGVMGIFYSLSTKKFHSLDGKYCSRNLYGTQEMPRCAWMKLPST